MPSIDAVLTLQSVGEPDERRKRALKRGNELLDRLDELRHGLLTGRLSNSSLLDLQRRLNDAREEVEDRSLAAVLDELDVRVAVELAKFGY
jgi:hypothetical protein